MDVGIKRGRCGNRVAGEAWHARDAVDTRDAENDGKTGSESRDVKPEP